MLLNFSKIFDSLLCRSGSCDPFPDLLLGYFSLKALIPRLFSCEIVPIGWVLLDVSDLLAILISAFFVTAVPLIH